MPRTPRRTPGGVVYHVLNRAVARITLFRTDADYAAFVRTLADAHARLPVPVLAYCVMPNHWHLVLRPTRDGDLSAFMQWLTLAHAQRWRTAHRTVGYGPLYQGRFKAFPVQADDHLLTVLRYVERNLLRANLVPRAQHWLWSSLRTRLNPRGAAPTPAAADVPLAPWPVDPPPNQLRWINAPQTDAEEAALRLCVHRSRPFGHPDWQRRTAAAHNLLSAFRPPGRPRRRPTDPKPSPSRFSSTLPESPIVTELE